MPERQPLSREHIAERVAGDPLLADFIVPFPNLLGRDRRSVAGSFQRMAELVGRGRKAAHIQFTLSEGNAMRHWGLAITTQGCKVAEREHKRPTLEIITSTDVWSEIASGNLSPLEAFGRGKLRVRGDINLARMLARKLQGQ